MSRAFCKWLQFSPALSLVVLLLGCATASPLHADPAPQRNILFFAVDDLRDWVNYSGQYPGTLHTPNIDALPNVSTRYLNAYAAVPHCIGSRTTVMMGMSPATHGLTQPLWGFEPAYTAIYNNASITSIPQVLRQNGYYTATAGKVFHSPQPARWDQSGPDAADPTFNMFDPGPDGTFMQAQVLPPNEEHVDQTAANWASFFLAAYSEPKPFFLAVGFRAPHIPWRTPQWTYDLYSLEEIVASVPPPGDLDDEPALAVARANTVQYNAVVAAGKEAEYTRAYLASVSHTDAMVGQVLAALAASPHALNTDIVLWSDHGYHLGEKFHWGKNTFWEQAARVPLLVSAPGNPNYPPVDITAAVSLRDVAPTVLQLAGVPAHPQFTGKPLSQAGTHGAVEVFFQKGKATITQAGLKRIDYDLTQPGPQDQTSYDLVADPDEQFNLGPPVGC